MKTQKQVALELIGLHVADYEALDTDSVYRERLVKARNILESGLVTRQPDGTYHVQGSLAEPYHVNGTCTCPDYAKAPKGWCKHRIAAKLHHKVRVDLEALKDAGIPHEHRYRCGHAEGTVYCWQAGCPDVVDIVCEACRLASESPLAMQNLEEPPMEMSYCPVCHEPKRAEETHAACALKAAEALETLPPLTEEEVRIFGEDAAALEPLDYNREQYEEAPGEVGLKVVGQVVDAMPEAPASMNLKIKLAGGHELMVTMRSMQPGAAGDDELVARLPRLLAKLEGVSESATAKGWLARFFANLTKCVTD